MSEFTIESQLKITSQMRAGIDKPRFVKRVRVVEDDYFIKTRKFLNFIKNSLAEMPDCKDKKIAFKYINNFEEKLNKINEVPVNCYRTYGGEQCDTGFLFSILAERELPLLKGFLSHKAFFNSSFLDKVVEIFKNEYQIMVNTKKAEKQAGIC